MKDPQAEGHAGRIARRHRKGEGPAAAGPLSRGAGSREYCVRTSSCSEDRSAFADDKRTEGCATEKGASVSASPRVAGLSASRWPQGAARAFMSAACSARAGKGSGLRVLVNDWRTPPVGHPRTASRPEGTRQRQAALGQVTGAGVIPKDQLPTSMSFAPPLPCGAGFAISVIQSCRSRRIAVSRWPRPVLAARRLHLPCVWLSGLTCAEAPTCPDNPLGFCPKAPASRFGLPACPCSGGAFPALAARLSHAEACEGRFGHRIRFVSIPPALASGTGRFPGWCPRTDPSASRRKIRVSIRCNLLISL
jgi:hypothetical protein